MRSDPLHCLLDEPDEKIELLGQVESFGVNPSIKWGRLKTQCVLPTTEGSITTRQQPESSNTIMCAQGRAAWLERGRRCSVQETPASCHRRWVKRNRIQDSSLGGSSDDEDLLGVLRGPSSFANAFLYVGLGTIAIGLVIAFVGTGEKGFKTVELRLIGPSLIGLGLFCCILRILFCICPSHCLSSSRRARNKKNAKIDADHRTSLLRGDSKRVSIARGPHIPTKQPQIYPKSIVKTKTYEGVEALRQIATTSLFLQNEQKVSSNRIVPIIKEPDKTEEPPLELKKITSLKADTLSVIDIVSLSDGEDNDDDARSHKHRPHDVADAGVSDTQVIDLTGEDEQPRSADSHHQRKDSKLRRQRTSVNQQKPKDGVATESSMSSLSPGSGAAVAGGGLLMETSLMIVGPTPVSTPIKSEPQSTLAVPITASLNATSSLLTASSATQSTSSKSAFGVILAPSIKNQPVPGSLSPLPSTSYQPSAAALMSHISPLTPSPTAIGLTHNSSTSSSSYLLSPPPMTGFPGSSPAISPGLYDPLTQGTNTITTTSSLLQSSAVTTTKTEPEIVLSPAKLGQ
ncbi:uncharacterized protein LOC128740385 [Sabethes cyaneus]|uniref:uncharacterized protein LOC128740385 n=1 Tax=Sabethes cyaneus TaxID=53552 RepID=UPI00237DE24D|nr:uncharacterized protein LOC128740385 [Sabethes cyaneus]